MMDSTHGASNPFAGVPESASLSQTTYFDADAPPEAEGEESAYVSFTVCTHLKPALASFASSTPSASRPVCRLGRYARAGPHRALPPPASTRLPSVAGV